MLKMPQNKKKDDLKWPRSSGTYTDAIKLRTLTLVYVHGGLISCVWFYSLHLAPNLCISLIQSLCSWTVQLFWIWFDSVRLKSIPPLMPAKDSTVWLVNSSRSTQGVIYATQWQPLTCRHACKAVSPSVLGLVFLGYVVAFQIPFSKGTDRVCLCLSPDKFSHDIQTACSLACQFILAGAG